MSKAFDTEDQNIRLGPMWPMKEMHQTDLGRSP